MKALAVHGPVLHELCGHFYGLVRDRHFRKCSDVDVDHEHGLFGKRESQRNPGRLEIDRVNTRQKSDSHEDRQVVHGQASNTQGIGAVNDITAIEGSAEPLKRGIISGTANHVLELVSHQESPGALLTPVSTHRADDRICWKLTINSLEEYVGGLM